MQRSMESTFPPNAEPNKNSNLDDIGGGMSSIGDSNHELFEPADFKQIKNKVGGFDFAGDTFSQISSTFEPPGVLP